MAFAALVEIQHLYAIFARSLLILRFTWKIPTESSRKDVFHVTDPGQWQRGQRHMRVRIM